MCTHRSGKVSKIRKCVVFILSSRMGSVEELQSGAVSCHLMLMLVSLVEPSAYTKRTLTAYES